MNLKLLVLLGFSFSSLQIYAATIPVTLENNNLRALGAGFDSRSSNLKQNCVDDTLETDSEPIVRPHLNPSGSFNLSLESSQSSLAQKLGIEAGGKYRSGATTTSASAEFLKESRSSGFSIGYNYVAESFYQETMENSRFRPIRPLEGFKDLLASRDVFFQRCGDEYVWQRNLAARLLVNVNVSFVSKSERNRFAAKFKLTSAALDISSAMESDKKQFSTNNQMSVRVIQIGGDPSHMGKLLCPINASTGEADPECAKNSQTVVECSFGDIGKCTTVIKNAIAYASAQDGNNFPSQIRNGKAYSVVNITTSPYVNLGLPFLTPPTEQNRIEMQIALQQLNNIFENQYSSWVYADKLYRGRAPRLTSRQKNEMEKLRNSLDKKMRRTSLAINNCYDIGYQKCQSELDIIRTAVVLNDDGDVLDDVDNTIEALAAPESLTQYCDIADVDHPEIKATIDTLMSHAINELKGESSRVTTGDKCYNLEDWYKSQTEINLAYDKNLQIADLRPITALTNITSLNLTGKHIENISHLSEMVNLETLYLDGNLISDLNPLTKLKKLKTLSVQNNKFNNDNFRLLSKMNLTLESLDARGNGDELECPLPKSSQCKILNFNKSINISVNYNECKNMINHTTSAFNGSAVLATGGFEINGIDWFTNTMQLIGQDGCTQLPNTLVMPRAGHTQIKLLDGNIAVIGGYNDTIEVINSDFKSTLVRNRMSSIRSKHTSTLLPDGRVIIVGGYADDGHFPGRTTNIVASIDVFDPTTKTIAFFGKLGLPRAEHTATLLKDGRILILGGYSKGKMIDIAEIIDINNKSIESLEESLNIGRVSHSAVALPNGNVVIMGGYKWDQKSTNGTEYSVLKAIEEIEIFIVETQSFNQISEKLFPARGLMQTWTLPDGRIMLIGGETKGINFDGMATAMAATSKEIQIYDPLTEGLYKVGELNEARQHFSVTPFKSKSLIISGGVGGKSAYRSSEIMIYKKPAI